MESLHLPRAVDGFTLAGAMREVRGCTPGAGIALLSF
jgi:hypothetical protein